MQFGDGAVVVEVMREGQDYLALGVVRVEPSAPFEVGTDDAGVDDVAAAGDVEGVCDLKGIVDGGDWCAGWEDASDPTRGCGVVGIAGVAAGGGWGAGGTDAFGGDVPTTAGPVEVVIEAAGAGAGYGHDGRHVAHGEP